MVSLEGANYLLDPDPSEFDANEPFGFYTTRWLTSRTAQEAESEALRLVRDEIASMKLKPNPGAKETCWVLAAVEVSQFADDVEPPGAGFSWFPQSADSN